MSKIVIVTIMHQYAPAFVVFCVLLRLSFNYTFPLRREKSWMAFNSTGRCHPDRHETTVARSKKMTAEENVTVTVYDLTSKMSERKLSGLDLRQYEQLVIMKKYPYLDLKELEPKYHPSAGKNVRQNSKFAPVSELGRDPSLCEDEMPNVEIMNRGLSGFAIPHITKVGVVEKQKVTDQRHIDTKDTIKKSPHILGSLRDDIRQFAVKKNIEVLSDGDEIDE